MRRLRLPLAPRVIGAIASIVVTIWSVADATNGSPPIVPLHTTVHLSRISLSEIWSTDICEVSGRKAYVLWIEPEYTTRKDLLGAHLVLNEGEHREPDFNLLAPSLRDWHGVQPFDFLAGDLTHGPDKMTYGATRTLPARNGGLLVYVKVLGAKVTEIPPDRIPERVLKVRTDWYQLDELDLSISVENGRAHAH